MIFQSTHPRRVRPTLSFDFSRSTFISIHAPAKGATLLVEFAIKPNTISIHAPAKGATRQNKIRIEIIIYFNPRTREGCDQFVQRLCMFHFISIHAPAKGATFCDTSQLPHHEISIHAPAKGATQKFMNGQRKIGFQSTHPRRVRQRMVAPFVTKSKNLLSYFI